MKTIITTLALLFCIASFAQEEEKADTTAKPIETIEVTMKDGKVNAQVRTMNPDSTYSDTTRIELKNSYITIVSKSEADIDDDDDDDWDDWGNSPKYQLTWWDGIDIGLNGILNKDYGTSLSDDPTSGMLEPGFFNSRYIAVNFGQVKVRLAQDYVGLVSGLTFQIYNYKFSGSDELIFAGDSMLISPTGEKNVSKNKLRAEYIGIPLLLEFNTSLDPKKSFHITAGVVGKVRLGNMYKQKYSLDGNNNKASLKGELGLNRWAVDATVRVGYRRLTLFGQVGLLPIFDNANTEDVFAVSSGFFIKF
ncbi:outer membrane beta-barrel protein [Cryomorphaceae bacterium 1068]|nr:outer membrane beta-barrel protein [Cryomorphaceae bacterium 1068]